MRFLSHLLKVIEQKQEEKPGFASHSSLPSTHHRWERLTRMWLGIFAGPRMAELTFLIVGLTGLAGCSGDQKPQKDILAMPPRLTVVVLEDAQLAQTLRSYEGQWQAETGSQLEVNLSPAPPAPLEKAQEAPGTKADVLVFRSAQLGQLAEAGQILPMTEDRLTPYIAAWTDLVEPLRDQEGRWGQQVYGLSLGSPVLVCYCRQDLLDRLGVAPPRTWEEYRQVAQQLKDRSRLVWPELSKDRPWAPALEPLAVGWAGWLLLARAASYAKHPNYYSTLFEMQSMQPRIAEPPFVRALEELAATAKLADSPEVLLECDPDRVRERFWQGECGLALGWPSRAGPEKAAPGIKCTIVPIPGSSTLWHPGEQKWLSASKGEVFRTPLLGISGRWAAIGAGSAHPEAALQLIFWLADKQGSEPRPAVCSATAVFRKSDLKDLKRLQSWVEPAMPPETAQQYAQALQQTFSSHQWLVALRIPGWQEYLAALDEAVHAAVQGKQSAQQALRQAAQKWQAITARFGLERQRQAYRRNLGLPD
ncbi:MAG: extracellular solute-binding protein [Thermoguttaceae bacterium]|nr:extracellular solute-binding protein [Thermoguttaceae bacterium]MDW8038440.1 extracellular solute-binding protein [Thermoguttaceae bacterium]